MSRNRLFWAAILIIAGILILLNNLGILQVNIWGVIWPLAIILIGVQMLWSFVLGRREGPTEQISIPLDSTASASIDIHHGAGRLSIGSNPLPGTLLSGDFSGGVVQDVDRSGPETRIKLRAPSEAVSVFPWSMGPREGFRWDLNLDTRTPISLDLKTGASETDLDLMNLNVTDLRIDTGASSTRVTLPANAGSTRVRVESGAASVSLRVPETVAARIRVGGAISSINVDSSRFPRYGDTYESPDFASAANRAEIDVQMGVGSVTVR